jgi:hypothetical protein
MKNYYYKKTFFFNHLVHFQSYRIFSNLNFSSSLQQNNERDVRIDGERAINQSIIVTQCTHFFLKMGVCVYVCLVHFTFKIDMRNLRIIHSTGYKHH